MKKVIIRISIIVIILSVCIFGGYKAYVSLTDQSHIDETFYQVQTDKLISNVRIVFLSDLHLSEFGEDNCELVALVQALNPDLILIGGDMNTRQVDDYSIVLSLCRQLLKITDVYYALGNHEVSRMLSHDRDIYYDLEATGVTMLHNVYEKVIVGENTLYIGGVSQTGGDIDTYSGGIIEKLAAQDGFKLLLSHYPSDFDRSCQSDIDLVLSGHLHGGQINLPYLDGLLDGDGGFFPKYSEGQFEKNNSTLIVSRGLGNSHKFPRVNNPPDLVIIDVGPSIMEYSTNKLMSDYATGAMPSPSTKRSTEQENLYSNMLQMMQRMEAENEELISTAIEYSEK